MEYYLKQYGWDGQAKKLVALNNYSTSIQFRILSSHRHYFSIKNTYYPNDIGFFYPFNFEQRNYSIYCKCLLNFL